MAKRTRNRLNEGPQNRSGTPETAPLAADWALKALEPKRILRSHPDGLILSGCRCGGKITHAWLIPGRKETPEEDHLECLRCGFWFIPAPPPKPRKS